MPTQIDQDRSLGGVDAGPEAPDPNAPVYRPEFQKSLTDDEYLEEIRQIQIAADYASDPLAPIATRYASIDQENARNAAAGRGAGAGPVGGGAVPNRADYAVPYAEEMRRQLMDRAA